MMMMINFKKYFLQYVGIFTWTVVLCLGVRQKAPSLVFVVRQRMLPSKTTDSSTRTCVRHCQPLGRQVSCRCRRRCWRCHCQRGMVQSASFIPSTATPEEFWILVQEGRGWTIRSEEALEVGGRSTWTWPHSRELCYWRRDVQPVLCWKGWKSTVQYERRAAANLQSRKAWCIFHDVLATDDRWRYRCSSASTDKSSASDPIPTNVLKQVVDILALFIVELFNRSLNAGHFPDVFRQAFVTLIVKKLGLDITDVSSYRPISNLSVLSKLLERLVVRQLLDYLTSADLLPTLQSGFRAGHSTETAVLRVLSYIMPSTVEM